MIYVLLLTIILLFFLAYKIFDSNIISPSVVVCIVFIISTIFAVLNVKKWNIDYSPEAYLVIVLGIITIIMTEAFIKWCAGLHNKGISKQTNISITRIIRIEKWKTYLILIFSVIVTVLYYKEVCRVANAGSIFGGSILYNYNQVLKKGGELGIEESMNPVIIQLSKIIMASAYTYLYAFINNMINKDKIKNNIFYLLPVVIYFFQSALSSSRIQFIYLIIYSIIISYILYKQNTNWVGNISYKYIKMGFLIILIGLPSFYFLGEHIMGRTTGNTLFQYVSVYAGGSIQHLNQYIQSPPPKSSILGEESFVYLYISLWKFGLTDFHRTVHLEYRYLDDVTHGNVYTFFRRPLQDFGIVGLIILTIIVFGIYSYVYYFKICNSKQSYRKDKIILLFAYLYYPIALASIDECATDLISFGNFYTYAMLIFAFWFFTRLNIRFKP